MGELIDDVITHVFREYIHDTFIVTATWLASFIICLTGLWKQIRGNPK